VAGKKGPVHKPQIVAWLIGPVVSELQGGAGAAGKVASQKGSAGAAQGNPGPGKEEELLGGEEL